MTNTAADASKGGQAVAKAVASDGNSTSTSVSAAEQTEETNGDAEETEFDAKEGTEPENGEEDVGEGKQSETDGQRLRRSEPRSTVSSSSSSS